MTVTPIRPNVEPEIDAAREMRDYAWAQIEAHIAKHGAPPASIAFVLLGKDSDDHHCYTVNSRTPANERESRMQICAASALLLQRLALQP